MIAKRLTIAALAAVALAGCGGKSAKERESAQKAHQLVCNYAPGRRQEVCEHLAKAKAEEEERKREEREGK
jgi:ABC-type metal ion transport system substrate-binding protein